VNGAAAGSGTFESRVVNRITGSFFVPRYQRGYRWGKDEVTRLLDDIQESKNVYYLQPIVVKAMDDGRWELIDGQQRLTTLYLILQFMRLGGLYPPAEAKYSLEYETRPLSWDYLKNPDAVGAASNIDFFHIFQARQAIKTWFARQEDAGLAAINLYQAFAERVRVIWYEAPDVDSSELFRRLNVGRIPLTDAELVKAQVLALSRHIEGSDRAHSIAAEWDVIERDLRDPELWAFITAAPSGEATHIRLLLDTMADRLTRELSMEVLRGRTRPQFHTFETLRPKIVADPEAFWNDVVDLQSLVLGWFEQRDTFHKIGYLTAIGVRFDEILDMALGPTSADAAATKSEFVARLDTRIRVHLGVSQDSLRGLDYEARRDYDKLTEALLLMNVETIRNMNHSTERFSFQAYAAGKWSLEHIHAQNSIGLSTADQWAEWLLQHRDALDGLTDLPPEVRNDLTMKITEAIPTVTLEKFHELEAELRRLFTARDGTSEADEHAISNLALLERDTNSALNNAVFEVKRRRVLALDRDGAYVPVCTRNVFLKYYTDDRAQQVHFWSMQDREAYMLAIERELAPYLSAEESER
jgi:hypothetical protein